MSHALSRHAGAQLDATGAVITLCAGLDVRNTPQRLEPAEQTCEVLFSLGRNEDDARVALTLDPTARDVKLEQPFAERTADVRAALREIDAGACEYSPGPAHSRQIQAHRRKLRRAEPGYDKIAAVADEPLRTQHRIEELDRDFTGEMPVAAASMRELRRTRAAGPCRRISHLQLPQWAARIDRAALHGTSG